MSLPTFQELLDSTEGPMRDFLISSRTGLVTVYIDMSVYIKSNPDQDYTQPKVRERAWTGLTKRSTDIHSFKPIEMMMAKKLFFVLLMRWCASRESGVNHE